MQLDLGGKTVLVTGGSKGIGLACAQSLLSEGSKVVICSRSQANIDRALTALPVPSALPPT
jgi:NAD(P)-dependent dehydrogenase (short-subunit alcohol dehydrogenase family)